MQAATTTNYTPTSPSITPNPTIIHESTQPEGTYQGELKENLRDGLGVFIWQNGDTYFGQWAEDKMHGKGIFCYNTGHYVEGNFGANLVNGPACLTYPDGSFIKGVFTNGELSGRVIFYQAETNVWYLQTYEAGKLQGIHYEGSGKPLTYDFCVNIYEEDPQAYSTRSADNNYKIAVTQKDSGILDSLGCFEMDAETRHFGVTKDNRISGFGLRVHPKYIEAGKYRDGHLEGFGRRLEFGKYLYEGEFLQGMPYGQGGLYQWKERTLIVGIFTKGMLMQKFDERFFSVLELDNFSRLHGHTGIREVIKFAVRTYEDAFAKSYSEPQSKIAQLNSPTTTIREIEYAKIIARETIIEQSEGPCHTTPATKGNLHEIQTNDYVRQRLKENPNFLKHKRSHSSESPFSQLFKIHVGNKQVSSQNNRRSASAIRHTNSQPDSGRNQLMFGSLSSNDPRFTLMNSSLHFNRLRSSEAGSPGAILTFGRSDEKEYPSVGDISPHLYSSLGSLKGLSQASPLTNPFTVSNNGSNLVLGSPPSSAAVDLHKKKVGSGWDLPSPVEKVATNQYQAKKLNRDRSASKSTVGLYNRIFNNGSQTTRQRSPVYQIDGSSTSREKGSSPSVLYSHKHTQSMLPGDSQNRGWETMRNPSSVATNSTTPTKNRKVGESPISRGNTVNSQMLTKKGNGSMSISSGVSQKKSEQKQAGPYGLVYVGSSAYAKKTVSSTSNNNNNSNAGGSTSRNKDVSPLGRNASANRKDNNIVTTKSNIRDQDSRMGKSPRVNRGSQAQSPAYTNDLSLQSYSISDKNRSDKKDGSKQVNSKGNCDKSPRSAKNVVMTAPTSPQKASSTAVENSLNTKQFMQKTAMESYSNSNNDEKLSARSKSPFMMTGGVIGESSLFRSKTPGGISDFDYQKTTVGTGRAQSPISTFRGDESPFVDSDRMTPFESQQNGRFSFIPENESPYSSITQRDSVKSTLRQDDSGSAVYKELIKEGKKTPVCSFDLSGKGPVVEVFGQQNNEVKEKGIHRRAASQVVLTETEKQIVSVLKTPKFSLANAKPGQCETPRSSNRYNTQLHLQNNLQATVEPIAQNNRKLTVDTRISTSPDRNKTGAGSPYKIDLQQQRINSRGASPRKDKLESPQHSQGSLCRHSHRDNDGLDSPPQYPVKKTCDPKMDTEYYKDSSRKGSSPPRDSKVLDTNRQGSAAGSPVNKQDSHTHTQTKESLASSDAKFTRKFENTPDGKESSKGQRRISITDIFRKSLTMVQSRGENGSEGGEFDMKALQTVVSRYDNCTDSRSLQAFPTKGSQKITESSPRQSLASKAMLTSYSNNMPIMPIQRMSPPKNTMEAKTSSTDKDLEYDLTERLKFCLEQTKANIARIEREAAEGNVYYKDSEFITGIKRQNPEMRPSVTSVTSVTGDIKTTGSSSINGKTAIMKEVKQAAPAEIISVKAKLAGNKGMLSARTSVAGPWALIKENPSLVNESGGETSRAAFTFRDQKDSEGVLNMVQKGYGNEGGEKTVKHYQRSSSLSKRQSKMAGLQVRNIALYKDDPNQSNERSLSRERNSVTDVKRRK